MSGPEAVRIRETTFMPCADDLRRQLVDLGQGLANQCAELQRAPTADGCERLALNCDGARMFALKLRQALLAEGGGDGR